MSEVFIVDEELQDIRIDKYLNEFLKDNSRTYIQKLIKNGNVLVNDNPCKANYRVQSEDRISVDIPTPVTADILPENIPIDIIYEDDDILIVNKPKDLVVHPAPGHYTGTLVNALM